MRYPTNPLFRSGLIRSDSSQRKTVVNEGSEFQLSGIVPDSKADIQISLRATKLGEWFPLYHKRIFIDQEGLRSGKITDIGEIEFPLADQNEYVEIVIRDEDGKILSERELRSLKYHLFFEREDKKIYFDCVSAYFVKLNTKERGNKLLIRLPEGDYKAWWRSGERAFKDMDVKFSIKKGNTPQIDLQLPSKETQNEK